MINTPCQATTALFASISNAGKGTRDALEVYLEEPKLLTIKDPLEHWHMMSQSGDPSLARMALDFLSVPGMWISITCLSVAHTYA